MFPSAGNAAMGGKRGIGGCGEERGIGQVKRRVEKKKWRQRDDCSNPCPCTGSMETPLAVGQGHIGRSPPP